MKIIKNILTVLILIFLGTSILSAQDALKKGVYILSGSISFSGSQNTSRSGVEDKSKSIYLNAQPSFNYFVLDRFLIGGGISFTYSESDFTVNYVSGESEKFTLIHRNYGIGPSIKYYFGGETIIPFVGVQDFYFNYGHSNDGNRFTASAGINCFLSRSAALEPFISYEIISQRAENTRTTFLVGIRVNYFIVN